MGRNVVLTCASLVAVLLGLFVVLDRLRTAGKLPAATAVTVGFCLGSALAVTLVVRFVRPAVAPDRDGCRCGCRYERRGCPDVVGEVMRRGYVDVVADAVAGGGSSEFRVVGIHAIPFPDLVSALSDPDEDEGVRRLLRATGCRLAAASEGCRFRFKALDVARGLP